MAEFEMAEHGSVIPAQVPDFGSLQWGEGWLRGDVMAFRGREMDQVGAVATALTIQSGSAVLVVHVWGRGERCHIRNTHALLPKLNRQC